MKWRPRYSWRTLIIVTLVVGALVGLTVRSYARKWASGAIAGAVYANDQERVKKCLWLDRNLANAVDNETTGARVLHVASVYGNKAVCQSLLANGANPNQRSVAGETPLHSAAASLVFDAAIVDMLLEFGAQVDVVENQGGRTPLHVAAGIGNPGIVEALLDAGASPNVRDAAGSGPLHHAAANGAAKAANILIERGADVAGVDDERRTPLHLAMGCTGQGSGRRRLDVGYDPSSLVKLLLDEGADHSVTDKNGDTPLHLVVSWFSPNDATDGLAMTKLVLAAGASPDALNAAGQTPRALAEKLNNAKMLELFRSRDEPTE